MFGVEPVVLLIMAFAMAAVGGIAYVVLYSKIEQERNTQRRFNMVQREVVVDNGIKLRKSTAGSLGAADANKRRKTLETSMKEAEKKRQNRDLYMKKPPLLVQMKQAGMTANLRTFYIYSVIAGALLTVICAFMGMGLIYLPAVMLVGTFGLPRWYVGRRRKKRVKAFLNDFPNALDILVRAVKSGLPLNDGIRLLSIESQEPVRTEFQRVIDAQAVGKSTAQACLEMQETMPSSEAAFFGIVIQIQSQAGGNLSEALGNLSKVIRDRKRMVAKVQALAMEAKASAYIIGVLPVVVMVLVYLSSPTYIMPLFITSTGHLILGGAAVWMGIGILVMKQMINFDM